MKNEHIIDIFAANKDLLEEILISIGLEQIEQIE